MTATSDREGSDARGGLLTAVDDQVQASRMSHEIEHLSGMGDG